MQIRPKLCLLVCILSAGMVQAQNKTLADLINQAKIQHQQNLRAKSSNPINDSGQLIKNPLPSLAPEGKSEPMLWSITGLNDRLVAEVIYKGVVHVLQLSEGDRIIGPWLIERFGTKGLYLVPLNPTSKNQDKVSLFLPAPVLGMSLDRFERALSQSQEGNVFETKPRKKKPDPIMADSLTEVMPSELLTKAGQQP